MTTWVLSRPVSDWKFAAAHQGQVIGVMVLIGHLWMGTINGRGFLFYIAIAG
jgi:hypothetical protein